MRAIRRDQYAMIGVTSGEVQLAPIELPWWSIDDAEWKVASLPGALLNILPSPTATPVPPVAAEETAPETQDGDGGVTPDIVYNDFWRYVSVGLAGLWIMTLIAWWSSRRPANNTPKEPEAPPVHKQQARFLKAARKAALAGEASGVKSNLLEWARLQWPDLPPRSIGDVARRVSMPLSTQLETLCSASYGPGGRDWDGDALAKSLRSFSVLSDEVEEQSADGLPPLSPV